LITQLKEGLKDLGGVESVVLFGSYARGDQDERSDIDLCVILADPAAEKIVSEKILDIEKKLDKNIQVVFTDHGFTGQDPNFIENILREGKLLFGVPPSPSLETLNLKPYILVKYDLRKLTQPEKMRFNRLLYGQKTTKTINSKTYVSHKKGLVEETDSQKIGRASLLVPQHKIKLIEKALREYSVMYRETPAWIPNV